MMLLMVTMMDMIHDCDLRRQIMNIIIIVVIVAIMMTMMMTDDVFRVVRVLSFFVFVAMCCLGLHLKASFDFACVWGRSE